MGAYTSTSAMFLPYNTVAVTTLDRVEFENNRLRQDIPHIDVVLESPVDIDIDESNRIYVANRGSNTISVIDGETLKLVKDVVVGDGPTDIAIEEDTDPDIVYVANQENDTVSVIDSETLNVIDDVDVGHDPTRITLGWFWPSPDYGVRAAYVTYVGPLGTSSIIDSETLNVTDVDVSEGPPRMAFYDDFDDVLYVSDPVNQTVSTIDVETFNVTDVVDIGETPREIAIDNDNNTAYVVIPRNDIVSVINGTDLRNIRNIANITVGDNPRRIAVDSDDNIAYVANNDSSTVSVINGTDLRNIRNIAKITVGQGPGAIAVDDDGKIVYVANTRSGTVSIINGDTLKVLTVSTGDNPVSIAVDSDDNIAYVANRGSNTISVVSGISKQVQAGVSFDVNPFHAGRIECKDLPVPTNQYFSVDFRTQCTARSNEGFQFSSWIDNLGNNSSRTISASQGDWFTKTLDWISGKPSPETLNVTSFGNFTANFDRVPPTIPPEYLATLFTVVVTAFVGSWLAPSFIGWIKAKKQGNRLHNYQEEAKRLYKDTRLSEKDKEKRLSEINDNIEYAYAEGKLNEQQYNLLKKRIESFVNPNENKTSANKLQSADETHTMKRSPI